MAVRVTPQSPQATQGAAPKGGDHLPAAVTIALESAGLLKGGASPQAAARSLLGALGAQGFGGFSGGLAAQLQAALASFQRANGLPVTGRLDSATVTLLQNLGVLPRDLRTAPGVLGVKDGFEGARPAVDAQPGAATQASEAKTIQALFAGVVRAALEGSQKAMEFLGSLFGGAGKGEATGADGSQAQGAGARDGQGATGRSASGVEGRGDGTGLQRDIPGFATKASSTEQSRASAAGRKRPGERGLDVEGDPDDDEGRGEGGEGASEGEGEGGAAEHGAWAKGARDGDEGGTERHAGNATSGDDDLWRDERGHAVDDDGSGAEAGHYRVPALSAQVERALRRVVKDAETSNRATTYTWDVHLYRPGVYAPGQKPEELLHLVVSEATAFDRAWVKAADALARLLERHEPEARAPTKEDVLAAIRRARAR